MAVGPGVAGGGLPRYASCCLRWAALGRGLLTGLPRSWVRASACVPPLKLSHHCEGEQVGEAGTTSHFSGDRVLANAAV